MTGAEKYRNFLRHPGYNVGGGGGGEQTSTTVQNIPDELKPLAREYTTQAIDLSQTPWTPYTGQRYEDLNPTQLQGLGMTANRALGGDALTNAGYGNIMDTLQGRYMNSNQYLDQMFAGAADRVTDAYRTGTAAQTDAAFANSRNLGGSAYQQAVGQNQTNLADSLGNLASNIYGNNYNMERANQLQAWGMAPQYGNLAYQDAGQLFNVGQTLQDQAQQNRDFNYEQFQEEQNNPYKNLAAMSGVFGSNLGSSSTTTGTSDSGGK